MKLRLTAMLCVVAIFFLLTPTSSLRINLQSSDEHGSGENSVVKIVPRKLRFNEEVTARESTNPPSKHHIGVTSSGKDKQKKKQLGKEEEEEIDPSQYLSMDYPKRRRRRPVHNKSLPLRP